MFRGKSGAFRPARVSRVGRYPSGGLCAGSLRGPPRRRSRKRSRRGRVGDRPDTPTPIEAACPRKAERRPGHRGELDDRRSRIEVLNSAPFRSCVWTRPASGASAFESRVPGSDDQRRVPPPATPTRPIRPGRRAGPSPSPWRSEAPPHRVQSREYRPRQASRASATRCLP